jgi:hypothetical protein
MEDHPYAPASYRGDHRAVVARVGA